MIDEVRRLISKYALTGIFIDTNILLLYLIGSFDSSLISRFKRTSQFTVEDFDTLVLLLEPFQKFFTTPNVLTEVSNLSGQLSEPIKTLYFYSFAEKIQVMEEIYIESSKITKGNEFVKIGLTDVGILELSNSKRQFLILTDDFPLAQYLGKRKIDVINFNHIRPLGWS